MSVILYDEEKFLMIAESLKGLNGAGELGFFFQYPEGWKSQGGLDNAIDTLVNDWYRANQMTAQRQYDDIPKGLCSLSKKKVQPYRNKVELYKSLQGLRYNMCDNGGETTDFLNSLKKLNRLIDHIAYEIIGEMPEYNKADTW